MLNKMEETGEVDLEKEKKTSKDALKMVEDAIQQKKENKERKQKGTNNVCPNNNWNIIRKKLMMEKKQGKKEENKEKVDKIEKKVKTIKEDVSKVITKSKKKRDKKKHKNESRNSENKNQSASSGNIIDIVFHPEKHDKSKGLTPIVSVDCEMVEVDHTSNGLARLSIVNYNGHILVDTFVRPNGKITNYRSWISGVYPESMRNAIPYDEAREKAIEILSGRIIVGHSLKHDFAVLNWEPLQHNVRDLVAYKKFHDENNQVKSLKKIN